MHPDLNREPGILTEADRRYLNGEEPKSKQARYSRRKGIRKRTKNGLLDFHDLRRMEREERRRIANELENENQLYSSLRHLIAFANFLCRDADMDFEEVVRSGVELATYEPQIPTYTSDEELPDKINVLDDVTVHIKRHFSEIPRTEILREGLKQGYNLDHNELGFLLMSKSLDEEGWEALKEQYGPGADD